MKKGLVISFPTDTVYGLATPLLDLEGIKRIYELKGRDFKKPLAVLCLSINQIKTFAHLDIKAEKIAKAFWPGALTLILETNDEYYQKTKERTIGVRIPNHKTAIALIEKLGPLKTTSVNHSGEKEINDYQEIKEKYGSQIDEIYPNDQQILEVSSTVIQITDEVKILREGIITKEMIDKILKQS